MIIYEFDSEESLVESVKEKIKQLQKQSLNNQF